MYNKECSFLPSAIITDQGGSEILAMKTIFPDVLSSIAHGMS